MKLKLNFGCGENRLDGWNNHDIEVDIRKPLPYGDGAADEILAEHVCEHITTPEFFRFLSECHRVLCDGGALWLSIPVLDRLGNDKARDIILGHRHRAAYSKDSLCKVIHLSPFSNILVNVENEIFGHWKVIGKEQDKLESFRCKLIK